MPRIARMIVPDQKTVYHVMSRTALDGFPFKDIEKEEMVKILSRLSKVYFTEILGFAIMSNHFKILARMIPEHHFSEKEIKLRFERYYGKDTYFPTEHLPRFRIKWASLSEFIKELKQTFTRFYNKRHHRRGTLWGERYKSLIVEDGHTLINDI